MFYDNPVILKVNSL